MLREGTLVKKKLMLLKLAETLGSVGLACRLIGYSRDSFYRFKKLYEVGGEDALRKTGRHKPCLKNRVDIEVENAVVAFALENPCSGQASVARELNRRGIRISGGGVRSIWLRHNLETFEKRNSAIEFTLVRVGVELNASQRDTLAKCVPRDIALEHTGQKIRCFVKLKSIGRCDD